MSNDITNSNLMKGYLAKHDFRFKKKLGQNFLTDANIAKKIVDALSLCAEDTVLEIGPGAGALTQYIAEYAKKVIAVEIDPFAIKVLEDFLFSKENVEITCADILKTDIDTLLKDATAPVKAISNLPYYITSPVIMALLESHYPFENIVVTMQREVAQRLSAKPGTKDYSVFSVAVDYYANVKKLFDIPASAFYPMPNVDSAVVMLEPRKEPKVIVKSEEFFFKTLKAGFSMRRKTLQNCLCSGFGLERSVVTGILEEMDLKNDIRTEVLDIETIGRLSDHIYELMK